MVRQFRDASLGNNTKDRAELESFLRATEKTDNPYVTFYFDVFTIERSCLAYATEYFEVLTEFKDLKLKLPLKVLKLKNTYIYRNVVWIKS